MAPLVAYVRAIANEYLQPHLKGYGMSALNRLQSARTLSDVADILGFKPKALAYLIRVMPPPTRYSEFIIPKRCGGTRTICAPNKKLALVQARLAKILYECEKEIATQRSINNHVAHGFRKGHSILSNAEVHRRRKYVLNVDLSNFFDTIHFGRVRGFFHTSRDFKLNLEVSTVIAQISCHNQRLPQGSPCSPVISNLIGNILDMKLSPLAKHYGCSYSRYADDLSFSTNRPHFPQDIASPKEGSPALWEVGPTLLATIRSAGFDVNAKKTRIQFFRSRQDVTGIVVNRHLNTPVEYRRKLRSMVHNLTTSGRFQTTETDPATGKKKEGTRAQLRGMLDFAYQVERWRSRDEPHVAGAQTAIERLFQRYLFYTEFAAPTAPAIIFEGKTDSVYLREAIRRTPSAAPALATGSGASFRLKLRLHRDSAIIQKLFALSSGGNQLKDFIKSYRKTYQRVTGPKGKEPVIVLMDNDSGFNETLKMIKNFYKITIAQGDQEIHIFENLYILLSSPYATKASHCIEDCLPTSTLSTKLGGKSFSKSNNFDPKTHYGKEWLANKVVKEKSKIIDFTGFEGIIQGIKNIIDKHPITPQ